MLGKGSTAGQCQAKKLCRLFLCESVLKKGEKKNKKKLLHGEKERRSSPAAAQGECSRRAGGAPGRQQQFPCGLLFCMEWSFVSRKWLLLIKKGEIWECGHGGGSESPVVEITFDS